jgi:hypothetical protein
LWLVKSYGESESLQLLDVVTSDAAAIGQLEVISAKILIGAASLEQHISHNQQAVSHGNQGTLLASFPGQPVELSLKV